MTHLYNIGDLVNWDLLGSTVCRVVTYTENDPSEGGDPRLNWNTIEWSDTTLRLQQECLNEDDLTPIT
jgi:hypothetical protein